MKGITPQECAFTSLVTWGLLRKRMQRSASLSRMSLIPEKRRGFILESLDGGPLPGGVGVVLLPVVNSRGLSTHINHS